MEYTEIQKVEKSLKGTFLSASDIYVDTNIKECEVKISVDEFQGIIDKRIVENGVALEMVDYNDTFPFKYVFSYKPL